MNACKHTSWLSFHGKEEIQLLHSSTLSDIVASLERPANKWPSLVMLVGNEKKSVLMREAISETGVRHADCRNEPHVCLQLDPNTAFSDHPILVAHSHIPTRVVFASGPETKSFCHRKSLKHIPWMGASPAEAIDDLHCRLLHPFADVICLFAADHDGLRSVAARLLSWFRTDRMVRQPSVRPRVLVICPLGETRSSGAVEAQLMEIMRTEIPDFELNMTLHISVYIPKRSQRTLREQVRCEIDFVRNARVEAHELLNAAHFDRLFRHATNHFVNTKREPFDAIAASRLHRPVAAGLGPCVATLLTKAQTYQDVDEFIAPFVAECLIRDNYPDDVHGLSRSIFEEPYF